MARMVFTANPDFVKFAETSADKYGVPKDLFYALIGSESSWNPNAIGPPIKGQTYRAKGIGQFIPPTAREYEIDPLNPYQSIDAAARKLRKDYDLSKGSWPEAIARYKGFKDYASTEDQEAAMRSLKMAGYQGGPSLTDTVKSNIDLGKETIKSAGEQVSSFAGLLEILSDPMNLLLIFVGVILVGVGVMKSIGR